MTRKEQLEFCKICKNKNFDFNRGIICGLTNEIAGFEISCVDFIEDVGLVKDFAKKNQEVVLMKTAGLGTRFLNFIIDWIIIYLITVVFGFLLGVIVAMNSPQSIFFIFKYGLFIEMSVHIFIGLVYYTILEYTTGRSIAKFLTATKVVSCKGEKPALSFVLLRSLCRYIPFEWLSFFGTSKTGWHDRFSKTRVINTSL
jgi:uncharacterized RDD family membrane protein YckC